MYLETLKDQERYGWCFLGVNDIQKVTRDDFTGCKTLTKVEPMYLEVKSKESMFNWYV